MTNAPTQVSLRKSTLILLLLGGGLIVLALILSGASLVSTHDMTAVDGSVVRFDGNAQSLRSYTPVIAFTTANGQHAEVTGETSSTQPSYDVGQTVQIFYDAAHPERRAVIDDFTQRWFPATVLVAIGAALLGIGIIFYRGDRPRVPSGAALSYSHRKQQRSRQNLVISLVPVVIGTAFLLAAAASGLHELHIGQKFNRAQGRVVGVLENERPYQPHSRLYSAVIVFKTATGRQISFPQGSSSTHNDLREGQAVDVLYDAQTPERAMIDSFWERWGLAAILFSIGFPFFAVGVFFVRTIGFGGKARKRVT
jgi:hypothetical protein